MCFADAPRAPTDRTSPPESGPVSSPRRRDAAEIRLQLDEVAFDLALVAHEAGVLEPAAARSLRSAIGRLGAVRQVFDLMPAGATMAAA